MQLYKKSALYLKRRGVQLRKTNWGWHPPPQVRARVNAHGSRVFDERDSDRLLRTGEYLYIHLSLSD